MTGILSFGAWEVFIAEAAFFAVYDRIVVPSSVLRCRIAAMHIRKKKRRHDGVTAAAS
jgi:hypothetical protein